MPKLQFSAQMKVNHLFAFYILPQNETNQLSVKKKKLADRIYYGG